MQREKKIDMLQSSKDCRATEFSESKREVTGRVCVSKSTIKVREEVIDK